MNLNASHAYVAYKDCGCLVGVTVDHADYTKQSARDVAHWIFQGLRIERVTIEEVRQQLKSCPHQAKRPVQGTLL